MVNLLNNLDRDRFEPHLAVGRAVGPYVDELAGDVRVHELGAERSRSALPALVRVVRGTRADSVLSTVGLNWATAIARGLFPDGTRVVLREGSSPSAYLEDRSRRAPRMATIHRALYPLVYGRADVIVCQSKFMKHDLEVSLGVRGPEIRVVPNPVDTSRVLGAMGQPCPVDDRPGPHVVSVGRLAPEKAVDVLLAAFFRLRQRLPAAQLWVLGDGPERQSLERMAVDLDLEGAVHFQGTVTNPFAFMARADVFVSASRYEGLSNAVLEALVCGTPVVATSCPSGITEIIEPGHNGWLAAPGDDADGLSATLLHAIGSGDDIDRIRIRTDAVARWDVGPVVRTYEALLEGSHQKCLSNEG